MKLLQNNKIKETNNLYQTIINNIISNKQSNIIFIITNDQNIINNDIKEIIYNSKSKINGIYPNNKLLNPKYSTYTLLKSIAIATNKIKQLDNIIKHYKLSDYLSIKIRKLTQGQQYILQLAIITLLNIDIIIIDNIFQSLSTNHMNVIINAIVTLSKQQNKTIILLTNSFQLLRMSSHVILINNNNILFNGTKQDFIESVIPNQAIIRTPHVKKLLDVFTSIQKQYNIKLIKQDGQLIYITGIPIEKIGEISYKNNIILYKLSYKDNIINKKIITLFDKYNTLYNMASAIQIDYNI